MSRLRFEDEKFAVLGEELEEEEEEFKGIETDPRFESRGGDERDPDEDFDWEAIFLGGSCLAGEKSSFSKWVFEAKSDS